MCFQPRLNPSMKILAPLLPDTAQATKLKDWDLKYSENSEEAYLFNRFYIELYKGSFRGKWIWKRSCCYLDDHSRNIQ